jgi:hypothetical protein
VPQVYHITRSASEHENVCGETTPRSKGRAAVSRNARSCYLLMSLISGVGDHSRPSQRPESLAQRRFLNASREGGCR